MKIGIDARFYGGEQSKGLGRYTQKLIEQLMLHEHTHEYVLFLQEEAFRNWKYTHERFTPVLAPYRWYTVAEQVLLSRLIHKTQVDLMHFPHFNVPLLYREPFVVTIHDLIILRFPTERATTLGPLLYTFKHFAGTAVMRHAVRSSSHIITVSEFSKQDIVQYYHVDPKKITVTYESAEMHTVHKVTTPEMHVLQQYEITSPYILYIGNAYPHKNIELLIELMVKLKKKYGNALPYTCVLVGREDYFYSRIKQEVIRRGVQDAFVFTGFIPDHHLSAIYQQALAYIFPSFYEGFGLPALEAMQYGVPVIAAHVSCLPEILGRAALYFNPNSVSGIIEAIHTISQDKKKREQLIQQGYEQVQRYSWKKMMQQTIAVYE